MRTDANDAQQNGRDNKGKLQSRREMFHLECVFETSPNWDCIPLGAKKKLMICERTNRNTRAENDPQQAKKKNPFFSNTPDGAST
jgi:hypothetical protein